MSHLAQEDAVVSLHHSMPLLLHLQFLQVEVEVHVRLWRLIVYHGFSVLHLSQCVCTQMNMQSAFLMYTSLYGTVLYGFTMVYITIRGKIQSHEYY